MAGPFPGMDPYLERGEVWPAVQRHLIAALFQQLLPALVENSRARVGVREYAAETPLFTSVVREQFSEEYVEIHARSDGRLVTLLEIVSVANRTTAAGRGELRAARAAALAARANVVEIDLLTQGDAPTPEARAGLTGRDYAVTVTRGAAPGRLEVYAVAARERLPRFRFPLAPGERDPVVDLQRALDKASDRGDFAALADYRAGLPAAVRLAGDGRAWAEAVAGG